MSSDIRGLDEVRYMLTIVACSLVDEPNEVRIEEVMQVDDIIYRLYASPKDAGKLIGKQGRTARSLRIVLNGSGVRLGRRLLLDIVDHNNPGTLDGRGDDGGML